MSNSNILDRILGETLNYLRNSQERTNFDDSITDEQLKAFFNGLEAALGIGDPKIIDPVLEEWFTNASDLTSSEFSEILEWIFKSIVSIAQSQLSPEKFQHLSYDVLSIFFHANQYQKEHELKLSTEKFNQEQTSLEQLEKSKSDFISIAAHELKTPLTLMEGYSAMLRDLLEQKKVFDEHIFLLIDGMDSGSRRLREIINDMIDVSLIDNELLSLTFQPSWLNKTLDRVREYYKEAAQSRQISIELNRFPGDDQAYFFDVERLFQAISNVVSNAIKYTPDGGKISLDGRKFEEFIEILIVDNGIGIDPSDQSKIFDKFQAVGEVALHSSGKLKFKGGGPGLGLPIAKGIIEAHGGRIWVESEGYDEINCPGSTFHILLPLRETPPEYDAANLYEPLFMQKSYKHPDEL